MINPVLQEIYKEYKESTPYSGKLCNTVKAAQNHMKPYGFEPFLLPAEVLPYLKIIVDKTLLYP